jgi:hypothetical protein
MVGFWEKVVVTFFGMAFHMATAPSEVINPKSGAYVGVGAFQLLKRSAYEAAGTHRRLAMEVIDDMKLGKIVKQAGFRSGVGIAQDSVVVRWHAGARNLINGVTKTFSWVGFQRCASGDFRIFGLLLMNVLPFAGLFLGMVGEGFLLGFASWLCCVSMRVWIGDARRLCIASRCRLARRYAWPHAAADRLCIR